MIRIRIILPSLLLLLSPGIQAESSPRMDALIREAAGIVLEKQTSPKPIPQTVIHRAKGIAIIEITKGGFGLSGQHGEGVLIAKTSNGWSAPSAFYTSGGGLGLQVGVEVRQLIYILNTSEAVNAFAQKGKFKLNAIANATAGPDSVTEEASTINQQDIYVYATTDGAFAGAAVGSDRLGTAININKEAYGASVTTGDILNGKIPPPATAAELYQALKRN
ncbi:MAG: lipid-binding SYLF domain-containing protein [Verrucomicrobiota bacterium]